MQESRPGPSFVRPDSPGHDEPQGYKGEHHPDTEDDHLATAQRAHAAGPQEALQVLGLFCREGLHRADSVFAGEHRHVITSRVSVRGGVILVVERGGGGGGRVEGLRALAVLEAPWRRHAGWCVCVCGGRVWVGGGGGGCGVCVCVCVCVCVSLSLSLSAARTTQ